MKIIKVKLFNYHKYPTVMSLLVQVIQIFVLETLQLILRFLNLLVQKTLQVFHLFKIVDLS